MAINSRSKGNRNERKAADLLKKWTKKGFSRTPSSGGLNWKSSNTKGDIVCTSEGHYFPFCVEVKAHKTINFSELLIPGKKGVKILDFWNQCKRDAAKCNKIPLLMMRYNGMPSDLFFIAIPTLFYKKLIGFDTMGQVTFSYWDRRNDLRICLIPSTQFFSMSYKNIKLLAKTYIKNGKKEKTK